MPCNYLVIGYGNTLRSDDGVGYRVAEIVATWAVAGVRSLPCHQLTPDLAVEIAQARVVLFVDGIVVSSEDAPITRWEWIAPDGQGAAGGHSSNPRSLLAIAQALYQATPQAVWLLVPILHVEFGETLSEFAQQSMKHTLTQIHHWWLSGAEASFEF